VSMFTYTSFEGMRFRNDHILFRPYSPRGTTSGGLWLERNPMHPRIWGWVVAVGDGAPACLKPGVMLVVKRHQGEVVAEQEPPVKKFPNHHYDVVALPIEAIQLAIDPPLVPMEAA